MCKPSLVRLRWLALLLVFGPCIASADFGSQWQASLCALNNQQPYIQLSYNGPITELYSPLCYHFAGYNETCLPAKKRWLTPATEIQLIAPGQVPTELLLGYTLLVRFPWHSDTHYRYALDDQRCRNAGGNHSG